MIQAAEVIQKHWQTAKTRIYQMFEADWFTVTEKRDKIDRDIVQIFARNQPHAVATIYLDPELAQIICECIVAGAYQTDCFDVVESYGDIDLALRLDQIKREYRPGAMMSTSRS